MWQLKCLVCPINSQAHITEIILNWRISFTDWFYWLPDLLHRFYSSKTSLMPIQILESINENKTTPCFGRSGFNCNVLWNNNRYHQQHWNGDPFQPLLKISIYNFCPENEQNFGNPPSLHNTLRPSPPLFPVLLHLSLILQFTTIRIHPFPPFRIPFRTLPNYK